MAWLEMPRAEKHDAVAGDFMRTFLTIEPFNVHLARVSSLLLRRECVLCCLHRYVCYLQRRRVLACETEFLTKEAG